MPGKGFYRNAVAWLTLAAWGALCGVAPRTGIPGGGRYEAVTVQAAEVQPIEAADAHREEGTAAVSPPSDAPPIAPPLQDPQPEAHVEPDQVAETAEPVAESAEPVADEIFHVYTRHLGVGCYPPPLRVYRYRGGCCWDAVPTEEVLSEFPGTLVIFVHGNRMELGNTLNRGLLYYRRVLSCSSQPVRMVVWSWPSEKIKGQIRDVRAKAVRAHWEGAYLAWFLNETVHMRTSLVGYSYGARVIASALQFRACGGLPGMPLPAGGPPIRVVFGAAAVDNTSLSCRGQYRAATGQMDKALILINRRDPVLKRYRLVQQGSRPEALGQTGLRGPTPHGCRIRQMDVTRIIGRSHYEVRYLENSLISATMRRYLLWN